MSLDNENSLFAGLNKKKKEDVKEAVKKVLDNNEEPKNQDLTQTITIKGNDNFVIKKKAKKEQISFRVPSPIKDAASELYKSLKKQGHDINLSDIYNAIFETGIKHIID